MRQTMFKKILSKISILGLPLALLFSQAFAQQALPEVDYQQKHGDWRITCHLIDEANSFRDCIISTGTTNKLKLPEGENEIDTARATVIYQGDMPVLILTALPATLLLPGLAIDVDGKPLEIEGETVETLSFQRCMNDGCITGIPIEDDKILNLLKSSNNMNLKYQHDLVGEGEQTIAPIISLKGFTAAFEDLQKQMTKPQ